MAVISEKYHQTKTQIRDDGKLIAAAKKDPRKFEPLYTKYYPKVLEFVHMRLDDLQESYDVTSNVFLKGLGKIDKYEHRGLPFSSWLFRVAINELNAHFRKTNKYRALNIDTPGVGNMLVEVDQSDSVEEIQVAIACMKRLSSADYILLEMRFFERRPFAEIGQILEITENNAKVKTYRALDKLRKMFNRVK